MRFDAKRYLEALGPPTYVDSRGREHTGRVLSQAEWLPLQERLRDMAEGADEDGVDPASMRRVVARVAGTLFPRPWHQWLNPFYRSVTRDVLALPPLGQLRALWSFIQAQGRAMGTEPQAPPGLRDLLEGREEDDDPGS